MRLLNLLIVAGLCGNLAATPAGAAEPKPQASQPRLQANLVQANNAFTWDLYRELGRDEGNLFYSPASISIAMAMALGGAAGETEAEMLSGLRLEGIDGYHEQFATLLAHWNQEAERTYQLSVANRLWAQRDYEIRDSYLALTRQQYHAPIALMDFARSEPARQEINRWVEQQTNDRIKDLIPQGAIDAMTRLVLTNAIYFKGDWKEQFKEEQTRPQPFFTGGAQVEVPLMYQQTEFGYFENEQLQALRLPYAGDDLSMVVLLPRQRGELAKLEADLTAENVESWLPRREREVMVWLPKFKMESEFNLNATLKNLGIRRAFTNEADFSGISGSRDLYISDVVHKAFVEVNEEGTEAAAATGVVIRALAAVEPPRIPEFRADHPFVFLIRDNHSGSILFVGRVANPAE